MNTLANNAPTSAPASIAGYTPKPHFLDGLAQRGVRERLAQLRHGRVSLIDQGERVDYGMPDARCPLSVQLEVLDPRFWGELAFGGSIGAGEAYMAGYWRCDDLTSLVRILLQNRDVLDGMEGGLARLTAPLQKILHWANRNTRSGSRRNIAAHYDLGNELFALFLDPTMMYSCAYYETPQTTLEDAQQARLHRVCQHLKLGPDDHLLEIGTGWGGMAIHAAKHYGCRVTTTTISRQQYELARERVAAAGLQDRITLLLEDYRDLEGQYDKLVSLEMIEAVGHQFYGDYFAQCARLLKDDGLMLLQAITIADQRYEAARKSVDFIQRHIFPGSTIPSITAMLNAITAETDMKLVQLDDIGPHYATTLRHWRERFMARLDEVRLLGYPDTFIRMWDFYLCYCEGGFEERALGDVHMLLAKPGAR
ncbi:cyclopropane-fatty-acyl-phospholipid synthase [Hylemonella gracilis str. Niagara R]|uniref:Cyclopropane-fatty-acyl-phospholipid synthase n=1 Tax=Hylemonella gracilis str. Niagara R TaxID=1458275 RepID=A0A016XFR1_9BURK|nr:cyclopropane-fatty-acyl-phospholipid synthase family protein [Hylemonella gracilis]EYC50934.1 cyclopropane-fatty-acyl-phospholipid synthase [Hylemonella gracilis str. Niagara R]